MQRHPWHAVVVGSLLAAGCRSSTKPEAPPAPALEAEAPASVPGCTPDDLFAATVDLGQRAAGGQDIVAADGCSLFDGKLLARGFPATDAQARGMVAPGEGCTADLKVHGSQVTVSRRDGAWMVTRVRNISEQDGAIEPPSGIRDDVIRAARCPLPSRRLKTDADASVALGFGLAAEALRNALAGRRGNDAVSADTRAAMDKVCASPEARSARPEDGGTLNVDEMAPMAAAARVLAGSLAVFGSAAGAMKGRDAELEAARAPARALLDSPPLTNLQGACATWRMATETIAAIEKPAPAPRAARKAR